MQGDDVEDVDVQGDDVEDKDVEDDEVQGDDVGDEDVEDDGVQGGDVEVDEVKDDDVEDDVKGEEENDVENDDVKEAENDDTEDADMEEEDRSPDNAAGFARACPGSRNVCPHVTKVIRRATFYRNLQEKCRRPDWAQNADTHFVRACAVEMHVHMSQETSEDPLHTEIYRKNAAAQIGPRTQTHTLCEPAQSKRMSTLHKGHLIRKFTVKMPQTKTTPQTLCEPAQSKRMSRFLSPEPQVYTEIYR